MMYGYYSDDERCFWYQKGYIQRKFVGQNEDGKFLMEIVGNRHSPVIYYGEDSINDDWELI